MKASPSTRFLPFPLSGLFSLAFVHYHFSLFLIFLYFYEGILKLPPSFCFLTSLLLSLGFIFQNIFSLSFLFYVFTLILHFSLRYFEAASLFSLSFPLFTLFSLHFFTIISFSYVFTFLYCHAGILTLPPSSRFLSLSFPLLALFFPCIFFTIFFFLSRYSEAVSLLSLFFLFFFSARQLLFDSFTSILYLSFFIIYIFFLFI